MAVTSALIDLAQDGVRRVPAIGKDHLSGCLSTFVVIGAQRRLWRSRPAHRPRGRGCRPTGRVPNRSPSPRRSTRPSEYISNPWPGSTVVPRSVRTSDHECRSAAKLDRCKDRFRGGFGAGSSGTGLGRRTQPASTSPEPRWTRAAMTPCGKRARAACARKTR